MYIFISQYIYARNDLYVLYIGHFFSPQAGAAGPLSGQGPAVTRLVDRVAVKGKGGVTVVHQVLGWRQLAPISLAAPSPRSRLPVGRWYSVVFGGVLGILMGCGVW